MKSSGLGKKKGGGQAFVNKVTSSLVPTEAKDSFFRKVNDHY